LFEVIPPYTVLYLYGLVAYSFVRLNYLVHWTTVSALPVLIYFDDTLLNRSDGSEDVIVVTEEGAKEVKKLHIEVSPVQLCAGIHLHRMKSIFPTIMVRF